MKTRIALFLLFLLIGKMAHGESSMSLSPTESFLKGAPGSSVSQEFVVINDGASPYLLSCFFEDVWFDGEKTISGDLGTIKQNQAGFQTQCSPNNVLVPPKFVQKIKVVGLINKDQVGETFTRFYAQMLPPEEIKSAGGNAPKAMIGYSSKIGALLSFTAEGTQKRESEATHVILEHTKKYSILKFQIHNKGNVHLSGTGTLVVMDSQNQMVEKTDVKIPFLYPGQTKSINVNLLESLKYEKYKALLSITGSSNESIVIEFSFENKPGV